MADKTPRVDALVKGEVHIPFSQNPRLEAMTFLARTLETELSAANAKIAELEKDAERYRGMREQAWHDHVEHVHSVSFSSAGKQEHFYTIYDANADEAASHMNDGIDAAAAGNSK